MGIIRWFGNLDASGNVLLVFRTEWQDSVITEEKVWNRSTGGWQDSKIVSDAWVNGDANIEEITHEEAQSLLPVEALIEKGLNVSVTPTKGVVGPLEVARAISRLEILPNPADPEIEEPEKFVESPWETVKVPTIDPLIWDNAVVETIPLADLFGTDLFLKRKRVRKHIEAMGQAMTPFRSYPLILERDNKPLIIDGHHRLMAMWLLGLDKVAVWIVKE